MAVQLSKARALFEKIKVSQDPAQFISNLCNTDPSKATFEGDWIDFKRDPGSGNEDNRKAIWSKVLGGFANSGDGIVIWGIEATKDPVSRIDFARAIASVHNALELRSRLTELQRTATEPVVQNVQIEHYELPNANGRGFVVCLIPASPFRPCRSEFGECKQFYIRGGDSFHAATVSILRSLFHPQFNAIARISVWMYWSKHEHSESLTVMHVTADLTNIGTGSARFPCLAISTNAPRDRRNGDIYVRDQRWTKRVVADGLFEFTAGPVIHPGQSIGLFDREWECKTKADRPIPDCDDLWFRFRFFAEGQLEQRYLAKFVPSAQECVVVTDGIVEPEDLPY